MLAARGARGQGLVGALRQSEWRGREQRQVTDGTCTVGGGGRYWSVSGDPKSRWDMST